MTTCTYPWCMRLYGGCGLGCSDRARSKSKSDKSINATMAGAHVSSCGKTITVECDDHDTKDAILNLLTGAAVTTGERDNG